MNLDIKQTEQALIDLLVAYESRSPKHVFELATILPPSKWIYQGARFERICSAAKKGEPFTHERFGVSQYTWFNLTALVEWHVTLATNQHFARLISDTEKLLALNNAKDIIPDFHHKLSKIALTGNETTRIAPLMTEFESLQEKYSQQFLAGQQYLGIPCGFEKLDRVIDGLRPGHLWVIGAYTSGGKSFFALNIAANLVRLRKRVVIYSLEMTKTQTIGRILGILSGVNSEQILRGALHPEEAKKVQEAKEMLRDSDMDIFETRDLSTIELSARSEHLRSPVDLFVLDFLGLVRCPKYKTEYETLSNVSKDLQSLALSLSVPFIALSQISNEAARSKGSPVIGFKGAGDIAAAADLAIELWHDEEDEEVRLQKLANGDFIKIDAVLKKNRHGRTGTAYFHFSGNNGQFHERKK